MSSSGHTPPLYTATDWELVREQGSYRSVRIHAAENGYIVDCDEPIDRAALTRYVATSDEQLVEAIKALLLHPPRIDEEDEGEE